MYGRTVTNAEKLYHDNLCHVVGCIACRKDGRFNNYVSIHHVEGRTKKDAHLLVLPLCAGHHQDNGTAIAVHPYKKRFENEYGKQHKLISECVDIIREARLPVPERLLSMIKEGIIKL